VRTFRVCSFGLWTLVWTGPNLCKLFCVRHLQRAVRRGVGRLSNYRGIVIPAVWRVVAELRLNASAKRIRIYVYTTLGSPSAFAEIGRLCALGGCLRQFRLSGRQSNSQSKSDKVSPTHFFLPAYAELWSKPQSNQKQVPVKPGKGWSNQKTFVKTCPLRYLTPSRSISE